MAEGVSLSRVALGMIRILGITTIGFIIMDIWGGRAWAPSAYCIDVCWNCPRDYECIYDPDALYCIDGACPSGAPCRWSYGGGLQIRVSCPRYNWCLLGPQGTAFHSSSLEAHGETEAWAVFSFHQVDAEGRPLDLRLETTNDREYARTQFQKITLEPRPVLPSALEPMRQIIFSLQPPSGVQGGLPRLRVRWRALGSSDLDFFPRPVWVIFRVEWTPPSPVVFEESDIIYSDVPEVNGQVVNLINDKVQVEAVRPLNSKSILFFVFRLPTGSQKPRVTVAGYTP